jgi:hypothetical protein
MRRGNAGVNDHTGPVCRSYTGVTTDLTVGRAGLEPATNGL